MDLQRISIKLYLAGDPLPDVSELIPVFHRWIQTRLLDDLLPAVAAHGDLFARRRTDAAHV